MTDSLDRDNLIELLDRLGSDEDEAVLAAARQLHGQVSAAGVTWGELLVADQGDEEADLEDEYDDEDEYDEDEDEDEEDAEAETAPGSSDSDSESLALIAKLLAKADVSDDLREELEGYKTDIADGEFDAGDRRYLRALHGRLTKRG